MKKKSIKLKKAQIKKSKVKKSKPKLGKLVKYITAYNDNFDLNNIKFIQQSSPADLETHDFKRLTELKSEFELHNTRDDILTFREKLFEEFEKETIFFASEFESPIGQTLKDTNVIGITFSESISIMFKKFKNFFYNHKDITNGRIDFNIYKGEFYFKWIRSIDEKRGLDICQVNFFDDNIKENFIHIWGHPDYYSGYVGYEDEDSDPEYDNYGPEE